MFVYRLLSILPRALDTNIHLCLHGNLIQLLIRGGSTARVKRSQLADHVRPHKYYYGSTGFVVVPQLFCNKSVLYVFFTVFNTSSSTIPFMNDFLGYDLADLFDLGQ